MKIAGGSRENEHKFEVDPLLSWDLLQCCVTEQVFESDHPDSSD